jgi:hypothetical protein
MSQSTIMRSLIVTFGLSLSGVAFAAPPSRAAMIPVQEEAMKMARKSPAAPGYRDAFVRFGVRSPVTMRPRAAR